MGGGWDGIPGDVFAEVLGLVPLCPRRRLRLVCRHWRDVIDDRTARVRAKVLAFFTERGGGSHAIVFDPPPGGKKNGAAAAAAGRELKLRGSGTDLAGVRMIGTCSNLLCVQRKSGGIVAIDVVARLTLDTDPPATGPSSLHESTYSFGCHPETGLHKVAHVPCHQSAELGAVHVLTLEDEELPLEWREVPAPPGSAGCCLRFGLVTVGGVTYWVTKDAGRIMSFDLKDESFAVLEWPPMPVLLWMDDDHKTCHLAEVRGRLGLVVCRPRQGNTSPRDEATTTEVWVLEGEREEERAWVRSFTVLAQGEKRRQEVAMPHVAHGKHVLTTCRQGDGCGGLRLTLSAHKPREERKLRCGVVRVDARRPETRLGAYDTWRLRTFAYVEASRASVSLLVY